LNVQFLLLLESFYALIRVGFEFVLCIGKAGDDLHFSDYLFDSVFQLFAVGGLEVGVKKSRFIQLKNMLRLPNVLVNARCDALKVSPQV
jgi:hypothetical protein